MTPLEYFETLWAVAMPTVPLVGIQNSHVDLEALGDQWAGVVVQAEETRAVTMGSKPYTSERGILQVGIFTKSGEGFTDNDALARAALAAYTGYVSPDLKFQIETVAGPLDIDPEADGDWFRLALELNYQLWGQRA